MGVIVKTVTRLTAGFVLLYGIYLALYNHELPGGGSAGGLLIALSFVYIMLAYGKEETLQRLLRKPDRGPGGSELLAGAAAFLFAVAGGYQFYLFFQHAKAPAGTLPVFNVDILLKGGVACAALAVIMSLVYYGSDTAGNDK